MRLHIHHPLCNFRQPIGPSSHRVFKPPKTKLVFLWVLFFLSPSFSFLFSDHWGIFRESDNRTQEVREYVFRYWFGCLFSMKEKQGHESVVYLDNEFQNTCAHLC